ncbi:MAG: hypothetical protein RL760_233 [Candidatus Eisenbacteria bacterium]
MRVRGFWSVGVGLLVAAAAAAGDQGPERAPVAVRAVATHPGTAALPPFTLFGWVSPPTDSTTPARYAELAEAGFNVTVLAWGDPGTEAANRRRLECMAPTGARALLLDNRLDRAFEGDPGTPALIDSIVSAYESHPSFLGYYLGDEPRAIRFPLLGEWFRLLRARDPGHPAWNNLSGRAGFATHDAFMGHLRGYVALTQPAVLCTDHYDHTNRGDLGQFVENVAGTAQVAREAGLPFWGVVLLTRHLDYREVDDALLRWQVAQWLAHGATGIGYFTYWTPAPDPAAGWQDGMIRWGTGTRGPHYDQVRTLNARLRPMGEALASLAWLTTEYSADVPAYGVPFAPDAVVESVEGRATLGTFVDAADRPWLFVANRDSIGARTITVTVRGDRRVERMTDAGDWQAWDSAPTAQGRRIALALAPGDFALLRLSGGCEGAVAGDCRARIDVSPDPAVTRMRFSLAGVRGPATLTLADVTGRRVWSRAVTGDAAVVEWDGASDTGERMRPGAYWARLADARGAVVRRVTWLGGVR